eukprot:PLAT5872.1.p1 GENE.PLAT5872.1~~PLAT5872.1.p1  ORF type:complete len:187 (+),score=68.65 PLAT5872.1:3-563(+)
MSLSPTFPMASPYNLRGVLAKGGLPAVWRSLRAMRYFKVGDLVGEDEFGNKYFEDNRFNYGAHRWVEYAAYTMHDATQVPPEWHGWLHYTYDENPVSHPELFAKPDWVKYGREEGKTREKPYGYGSGEDPLIGRHSQDAAYKQPGHPLAADYKPAEEDFTAWSPLADDAAERKAKLRERVRDLDLL